MKRNRAKRRLRAQFNEYSNSLKDGTYIFVAKQSTPNISHEKLSYDFKKVLQKSKCFQEI